MTKMMTLLLEINQSRINCDYLQAIQIGMKAIEKFGETCEFCELLSDLYFSLGVNSPVETGENYQNAIGWLKRAIKIDGTDSVLHVKLGDLYWLGALDYSSAEEEYRCAISLNSNNRKALINLAALYGSPDSTLSLSQAILYLTKALEIEPDDPNVYARLGELFYENGNRSEANKNWLRALTCSKPLEDGFVKFINEHYDFSRINSEK